ncbi:murein hydrolase activator EnvC family protein [uncultured Jatrophihabitans sp.]|uniref:murein hydrolase activator EnvC family protein n=1 Tax=uncultured Jatrophihabitans sp. TaxID=1610747 RepID=UPI0035CA6E6A
MTPPPNPPPALLLRRRRVRAVLVAALLGPLLLATGAGATTLRAASRPPVPITTYRPPVLPLLVLRAFRPPAQRYGAGHLGVDLAARGVVRSAGPGTVTFVGSVAGRGVVVVLHPDGIRTEYEPLRPAVTRGQLVAAGTVLGTVHGTQRGCRAGCLHWGARRGDTYLDPLSLLRPLGPVRLLPWAG